MKPVELTPDDLRERMQLPSREMAIRLIRTQPLLRGYKVGRFWRVSESDYERWVDSLKHKPSETGTRIEKKLTPMERRLQGKAY